MQRIDSPVAHRRMRRDAAERRDQIVASAIDCFQRLGFDVSLEEIARRSGVGRGTLYRNFRDRIDLILAILEAGLDDLRSLADAMDGAEEAIAAIVTRMAEFSSLYNRVAAYVPQHDPRWPSFRGIETQARAILQPVVERAQRRGKLRSNVDAGAVLLVIRMIGGLLVPSYSEAEARLISCDALALVMEGLRPR